MKKRLFLGLFVLVLVVGGLIAYRWLRGWGSDSNAYIREWLIDPTSHERLNTRGAVACEGAPFILPSEGLIGLLWRDPAAPYTPFRRHTGIDIFGAGPAGTVPIYAAYDGYLTRLEDWLSTVIIRHDDPLQAGRTIWTYYTHMASRDGSRSFILPEFVQGTSEQFVEQGTLLGYQGEYAGSGAPIAMHLHFSIVKTDQAGDFLNEAVLENTLDPTPYFGLNLTIDQQPSRPIRCPKDL